MKSAQVMATTIVTATVELDRLRTALTAINEQATLGVQSDPSLAAWARTMFARIATIASEALQQPGGER
jgi:hypothetical protein